jgi:hypothetical protein
MLTAGEDKGERDQFFPAKTKVREGRFVGASAVQDRGPFFLYGSHAMRVAIYARVYLSAVYTSADCIASTLLCVHDPSDSAIKGVGYPAGFEITATSFRF